MCGIAALINFDNSSIDTIKQSLYHRGPDKQTQYQHKNLHLIHTRLSIQDIKNGDQPFIIRQYVIVFNGEIYNYKHIRAELISKGFVFRGDSDTEVLLNLYLYEGESMLQRLEGIFSFAIWDSQKNRLFIARDALGVKPLYYRSNDNYFAFASELKALIKLVPEEPELDFLSLHRYLSFLWCPGVGTPLKSFFKLQPGEAIFVNEGCIQKRWIWYQLPVFWKNTKKFKTLYFFVSV